MALFTAATTAANVAGFDFKKAFQPITGIFNNDRGSKRDKRDAALNALYQMGMSKNALSRVHSNHYKDLQEIVSYAQTEGKPFIDYLNRTRPPGVGDYWDNKIIKAYELERANRPAQTTAQKLTAASSVPDFFSIDNDRAGLWILGGLFAAGVIISNWAKWFK